ncbi:MAG TPA: 7-cyano-7-deazaguanine synthase [Nitrososphaeraceae archaeon]|nr:7-cyano-7-deazaguanine synthase [Nitrososphaeraceae archaeon]
MSSNKNVRSSERKARAAAVCIVSGGLDSICTAAYLTREKGYDLYMLTYIYGQRAKKEVQHARAFSKVLKAKDHRVIDIAFMKNLYGRTNVLTDSKQHLPKNFDYSIVVPIRNAIFITIATAWAMSIKANLVAYGAHGGDSHYPDCRPEFIKSITKTLNLAEVDGIISGLRHKITVWSPAMDGMDKSKLLSIGYKIMGDEIFNTWSCYSKGVKSTSTNILHCGICESCINRKIAISKAGIKDKTHYAKNY